MAEIGATLREARMRARIDVSEIEAQTKIRAKYLRALENEEWDLLPGPTFVRSFLRTYAQALGLDDKALVDEYRRFYEQPSELEHQPVMSAPRRARARAGGGGSGPSRGYMIAIGVVGVVIVLLIVGLLSKKGGGSPPAQVGSTTTRGAHSSRHKSHGGHSAATQAGTAARVALSLHPTAAVYVCLIDATGAKRIPGLTLEPGSYTPRAYHSTRFELLLGNNAVTMYIDGKAQSVPASSKPIAYSITSSGRRTLATSQQPKCE
ncbi:MAG TPA: helix-turn-helix domain-containing protein [Solirubrobacteraceae bacterium]|jgi:cytoskeleton protein RodZ|nr:helix-turn-helix domain-containing protein [Solirubrobacteraceae bacterium]